MAKSQTSIKRASQETPKISPETAKAIAEAKSDVERFSRMMGGLDTFCCNVDEGKEEIHDFSFAVSTLSDLIRHDADRIAAKLGKILEG